MVLFTLSIFCVPQLCKQIGSQSNVLSKIAVAENVPVHFKVCHISNLFLLNLLPLQVFVFIYCNKSSCVSDTQIAAYGGIFVKFGDTKLNTLDFTDKIMNAYKI